MRRLLPWLLLLPAAALAVDAEHAEIQVRTVPAGAAVSIDGVLVGLSPRTETLSPGVHTLTAESGAAISSQTISVVAGEVRSVTLTLTSLTPPRLFPVAGVGTFAGGAVALGLGLLLQAPARAAGREVQGLFERGGGWDEPARALEAAGLRAQTWSWIFTIGGAAAMAAGLLVTGLQWFGPRTDLPALALLPTPEGALLSWGARW